VLRAPELDAGLQGGLTREEQRGRITSLDLLPTLLLMQPRIWLALWAARYINLTNFNRSRKKSREISVSHIEIL